jgi:hypothetical protein
MATLHDCLNPQDLCRKVTAEPNQKQRAEVIAQMRGMIAEERRVPQSQENTSYLTVAEMVLDFLEETLESRYSKTVQ